MSAEASHPDYSVIHVGTDRYLFTGEGFPVTTTFGPGYVLHDTSRKANLSIGASGESPVVPDHHYTLHKIDPEALHRRKATKRPHTETDGAESPRPKKQTGYFMFMAKRREELKAQGKKIASVGELAKELGAEWQHLSDADKKHWTSLAAAATAASAAPAAAAAATSSSSSSAAAAPAPAPAPAAAAAAAPQQKPAKEKKRREPTATTAAAPAAAPAPAAAEAPAAAKPKKTKQATLTDVGRSAAAAPAVVPSPAPAPAAPAAAPAAKKAKKDRHASTQ